MAARAMTVGEKILPLDEDGFLQRPDLWGDEVAEAFARLEGIGELTAEHWKVIRYLRDFYLLNRIAPLVRRLCRETGFDLRKIYALFPSGPAKGACKVAGLPRPDGCV